MFHRPRTEETVADTQTLEKPVKSAEAVKAPVAPQQEKIQQQTERQIEEKKMNAKEDQDARQQTTTRPVDIPGQAKPYQASQGGVAPRAMPGNYAYPGASSSTQQTTGSNAYGTPATGADSKGSRLVIGAGITMSGEIESCSYLLVEGTVEAALKGASVLEIAETGVFYGTVEINEATVSGRFEGDITVNGRLTITSTGSITGTISYKELAIEAGATLDGKVSPLTSSKDGAKTASKTKAQPQKQQGRTDSAGEGNELPFAGNNTAAA